MILDQANVVLNTLYAQNPGAFLRVLEAGGGSHSHFARPDGSDLIALDIAHGQLVRNEATPLRVQADVARIPLADASVNVILCFNVLEHVEDAAAALQELRRCLKPGGALVLGFPNRGALKALVTRATPIGVHRAWYRHVVGKQDRGEGHFDAFPTVFHPAISISRMRRWLSREGLESVMFSVYDGVREYGIVGRGWKSLVTGAPYYALAWLGRLLSLGVWRADGSDVLIIARLPR